VLRLQEIPVPRESSINITLRPGRVVLRLRFDRWKSLLTEAVKVDVYDKVVDKDGVGADV